MRHVALSLVFALAACGTPTEAPEAPAEAASGFDMTVKEDRVSWAIGYDMGSSLKRQEIGVNLGALAAGMDAAINGEGGLMTEEEVTETLQTFRREQREADAERRRLEGERNTTEGAAFLAENGAREGVVTTESGLQYEVLTPGSGASPGPTDRVTVHYRGTLIDGTEFDSSHSRGEPATFRVNGVIRGWTEALQLMSVGAKYKLFIPGELAYGPRGSGAKIGPNAVLVFEVELLGIE